MFDIAVCCSNMLNIDWDDTFRYCSGQTSQMDTGIGVIFQRTKPCSQFYCSGENTYRQYYQQKALEVPSNNSLHTTVANPVSGVTIDQV